MSVFAQRLDGRIVGLFACPQPGVAEEELEDDHADVVAFRAPRVPEPRQQIDALERQHLAPRWMRELALALVAERAVAVGVQPTALPAYVKLKALDDQIAALRRQL